MQLTRDNNALHFIRAWEPGRVRIADRWIAGNVIVGAERIVEGWTAIAPQRAHGRGSRARARARAHDRRCSAPAPSTLMHTSNKPRYHAAHSRQQRRSFHSRLGTGPRARRRSLGRRQRDRRQRPRSSKVGRRSRRMRLTIADLEPALALEPTIIVLGTGTEQLLPDVELMAARGGALGRPRDHEHARRVPHVQRPAAGTTPRRRRPLQPLKSTDFSPCARGPSRACE